MPDRLLYQSEVEQLVPNEALSSWNQRSRFSFFLGPLESMMCVCVSELLTSFPCLSGVDLRLVLIYWRHSGDCKTAQLQVLRLEYSCSQIMDVVRNKSKIFDTSSLFFYPGFPSSHLTTRGKKFQARSRILFSWIREIWKRG